MRSDADRAILRVPLLLAVILLTGCPARHSAAAPGSATQPRAAARAARVALAALTAQATSAPDMTDQLVVLRKKWVKDLGEGYHAAVRSPFLVVIDGEQGDAQDWLDSTVAGAARRLTAQYFTARPANPIVILLFSGQAPYRKFCKDRLNDGDPPKYGFFRPSEQLLVMDIHTGGGTLVHELTHALIAPDFPTIPDWFNEGVASLYEQSNFLPDRIVGLVNWRLPDLQKAMKDGRLGTLEELTQANFRGEKMGLNYAQARYLCFYMQDKGLLETYYKTFRDRCEEDPTGLKFLKETFAPTSLADVDKEWRKWVMTLH